MLRNASKWLNAFPVWSFPRHTRRRVSRSASAERGAPRAPAAGREAVDGGGTPAEFFAALATHWKRHYAGWTVWVLSPEPRLPSLMRLKESRRVPLWNGPIECRLLRFDMVAGSAR